jgi:galactokinase
MSQAERARSLFRATFGGDPVVIASAPGRVNLIGEHTDYNGGEVLPIAIQQRLCVAMAPGRGARSRAVSAGQPAGGEFSVHGGHASGAWWDYVHGSLHELRTLGVDVPEVDVAVVSQVPAGAGLSSSAALEVAALTAGLVTSGARLLDHHDALAAIAHRVETGFVGVPCGMMDQTASAYSVENHALRVFCDSQIRELVPFHHEVLIVDTAVPRELRRSRYNERVAECQAALERLRLLDPALPDLAHATVELIDAANLVAPLHGRARHVVTETRRVGAFVDALAGHESLGPLLESSHRSLRDDFECSTPELDWVVAMASRTPAIDGARLTGAGWGGCAIVVGAAAALTALEAELPAAFRSRWKREPRTWRTHAEAGVDVEWAAGFEED